MSLRMPYLGVSPCQPGVGNLAVPDLSRTLFVSWSYFGQCDAFIDRPQRGTIAIFVGIATGEEIQS